MGTHEHSTSCPYVLLEESSANEDFKENTKFLLWHSCSFENLHKVDQQLKNTTKVWPWKKNAGPRTLFRTGLITHFAEQLGIIRMKDSHFQWWAISTTMDITLMTSVFASLEVVMQAMKWENVRKMSSFTLSELWSPIEWICHFKWVNYLILNHFKDHYFQLLEPQKNFACTKRILTCDYCYCYYSFYLSTNIWHWCIVNMQIICTP